MKSVFLCVLMLALLAVPVCGQSVLTIGNSLTWDAVPASLDGDVDWHVTCNKNLQYIYTNPDNVCVSSSTPWTDAIANNSYDFVTVQPFTGTSLAKDTEIISVWMHQQPESQFILHTGWSSVPALADTYEMPNLDDQMRHSSAYFNDLLATLEQNYPEREVISTHALDMLYVIAKDIEHGVGPFEEFDELFRDLIHLDPGAGSYLVHNAMRQALGQPLTNDGFSVSPEVAGYLNFKIQNIEDILAKLFGSDPVPGPPPNSSHVWTTELDMSPGTSVDPSLGATGIRSSAVPEPASTILLLTAGVLLACGRRA